MVEWRSTKNGIPRTYVECSGVSHTPFSMGNFHGESLCGEGLWISTARNGSKFLSTPIVALYTVYSREKVHTCVGFTNTYVASQLLSFLGPKIHVSL